MRQSKTGANLAQSFFSHEYKGNNINKLGKNEYK